MRRPIVGAIYLHARSNYVDVVEVPLGCVVGVVTLHDCWPTRLAEAKAIAGRAYTAEAAPVHWDCVPEEFKVSA